MREYQREYHRKRYSKLPKKYWLKWVQLDVYNYMVEQYQLWDRVPRWTQIAKALNIWEQTVYNAVFALVKKWFVGRWQAGKYYLINPPIKEEGDEIKKELEVMWETFDEPEMVYVEENKYDEMEEKIKSLEEQVSNSVWHIEWLMNSNTELEKKNIGLLHQIEELKLLIKLLYKYFGNV
jgi:predicted DNA-binding transcriptional regulator